MKKYIYVMILAGIAIVNASYLSYKAYIYHYVSTLNFSTFCSISSTASCTNVLASPESLVFGIPFPWIALVVYPVLLFTAWRGFVNKSYVQAKILAVLSAMGMCFNGTIIYREITIIHAYCLLCLMCSAIIVTIFGISVSMLYDEKRLAQK